MKRIFVCFAAAVLLLSACVPNGGTLPGGEGGIGGVPTGSAASSDPVSFPNTDDLYTTDTTVAW